MNLRLNPPRAAQAVRINRKAWTYRLAILPPPAPVGFWRWALGNLICWGAVVLWFAAVGALYFAVASS